MGKHEELIGTLELEDSSNNGIYKVIYITFSILLCITILSGIILSNTRVSAETTTISATSSATASVNVNAACTLSATGTDTHTATITGGQYNDNVGTTTVKSICNDNGGYALYAIGYSNNEYGNNKLINSSDSSIFINTGTAASGDASAWSMKLTAVGTAGQPYTPIIKGSTNDTTKQAGDPDYSTYAAVPTTYTKVAYYPNSTMNPSDPTTHDTGSSLTTTYGIYVSPTQAAGIYTGAVKYTLVHPNDTTPPVSSDCNPNGSTIGAGSGTDIKCMQDISSSNKDALLDYMITDKQYQLMDIRDKKTYWIAKLQDGNIWMTQNLDLIIGGENTSTLTSENTDLNVVTDNTGIYFTDYTVLEDVIIWEPTFNDTVMGSPAIITNFVSGTPSNSVDGWQNSSYPFMAEGGENYVYISSNTDNDIIYNSLAACIEAGHVESDCDHYHVGNYYNWPAAIASGEYENISIRDTVADNSICPSGWKLPNSYTNSHTSEFGQLFYNNDIIPSPTSINYTTEGFNNLRISPLYFVRGGNIRDTTFEAGAEDGYYWSSNYAYDYYATLNYFNSSALRHANAANLVRGSSVRCLVR